MKKQLAVVHNTLGLVELKKKNISPAIKQFKEAVELNPNFAEARMNLAALSLNNRDYNDRGGELPAVLKLQPKNFEAAIGLGVALRGNKKIDEAEAQYNAAKSSTRRRAPATSTSACSTRSTRTARSRRCRRRRTTTASSSATPSGGTPDSLKREAEKRIKDIDEIYVALDEAAKMQAEAEEMQKKAEEQQKKMEEQMKKQEEAEKKKALPTRPLPRQASGRRQGRCCRGRRHGRGRRPLRRRRRQGRERRAGDGDKPPPAKRAARRRSKD